MIRRILIVDDSPISRKMLKSCIPNDRGYEFFEAGNGLEGFEQYKAQSPHLTFMDLTMPVMDGNESLAAIKEFDNDAVVIVSTADVQVKSLEKVQELGAFMILKKPPNKETVAEAIAKADVWLENKNGN